MCKLLLHSYTINIYVNEVLIKILKNAGSN